jgi:hypothetical protein
LKRDWDLIRDQLLAIEEDRDFKTEVLGSVANEPTWVDGQSEADYLAALADHRAREERVFGHLRLLIENGFIDGVNVQMALSGEYLFSLWKPRLTMAGHDLLDTMRSRTLWERVKSTAKEKGLELTFDSIKALAGVALKGLVG